MSLTIKNFGKKDVGIYYCVATNSLGKAEGTIRLHGKAIAHFAIFSIKYTNKLSHYPEKWKKKVAGEKKKEVRKVNVFCGRKWQGGLHNKWSSEYNSFLVFSSTATSPGTKYIWGWMVQLGQGGSATTF